MDRPQAMDRPQGLAHAQVNKPGGQLAGATTTVSQSAHAEVDEPGGQLAGTTAAVSQSVHAEANKPKKKLDWYATEDGHEWCKQRMRLQQADDPEEDDATD